MATAEPGQRSALTPGSPYLTRMVPPWGMPETFPAERWRRAVREQPIAMICRDTIVENILSTPWRIVSKDSDKPHTKEVDFYTDLVQTIDGGWDIHIDLVLQDALDIPFGGGSEVGRAGDNPEGDTLWVKRVDGASMVPTFNDDWPVAQIGFSPVPTYIPKHAFSRIYYTPRPEFRLKGWGMAPPEKIFLALLLLYRGDKYYANLLLDTPEAGVLDLGDMDKETAEEWVSSWRLLLAGTEVLKVPVLYEHTTLAKYIPFGRSPNELSYEATTLRYIQFVAAGYGLTLADIGITEGAAGSLAGTIRSERRSFRTGIGTARTKVINYVNRFLPPYLRFEWIITDDEMLTSRGRSRLANSMAMSNLVTAKILNPTDGLEQLKSDGLITVTTTPVDTTTTPQSPVIVAPNNPIGKQLGKPVPASDGGMGEVKRAFTELKQRKLRSRAAKALEPLTERSRVLADDEMPLFFEELREFLGGGVPSEFDEISAALDVRLTARSAITNVLDSESWWKYVVQPDVVVQRFQGILGEFNQMLVERAYLEDVTRIDDGSPVIIQNPDVMQAIRTFAALLSDRYSTYIRDPVTGLVLLSVVGGPDVDEAFEGVLGGLEAQMNDEIANWILDRILEHTKDSEKVWKGD